MDLDFEWIFFCLQDTVGTKDQSKYDNNVTKYSMKDGSNNFHVVELEDKRKFAKDSEEDYDPYAHREVQHPTTFTETLFHLMKGSLGTGILAMPNAFANSGYAVGFVATIIIGLLCTYCIRVLIQSEYELCKRRKSPSMTYPSTMEAALEEGPTFLRPVAKYCPHIVNLFLMVYQLGTCCVYTVFIAENLQKALYDYTAIEDKRVYMLILLLPLILINWVRNLKLLAPLSTLANGITFVAFGFIIYYIFRTPISLEGKEVVGEIRNFPLFLGTVLFALEAIGVIMPLENEMKKPKKFMSTFGVLHLGMALNIVLYVGMGLFGYLRFGKHVSGTITADLPHEELGARIVQISLAVAIFISHSLQCYVAIDISWNHYVQPKMKQTSAKTQIFWEYAIRTFLVIITFLLAVSVPELELFISLFGALCLSMLGITFPALIQTCAFWKVKASRERFYLATKNTALILFGILGLVVGTTTSMQKILEKF
ncbi:hypothetical protein QAD02_001924 [Eretmocerus hayati]|uniref:Uncharacterized protein n=1 Tax=Eretmocerus hayati TaxID=131215 RepID=A0ACC2NM85_9HYME|nr:hypothetical protein QAD02_001924 [Eretmocerus hayati]